MIGIITDSTCDIPENLLEQYGIMVMRYLSLYGLPPKTNKNYHLDELVALVQGAKAEIRDAQIIARETNAICVGATKS